MKYVVTIQVGGPGTFWDGFTFSLGQYRWFWTAWLAAKWHLYLHPVRAATIEREPL